MGDDVTQKAWDETEINHLSILTNRSLAHQIMFPNQHWSKTASLLDRLTHFKFSNSLPNNTFTYCSYFVIKQPEKCSTGPDEHQHGQRVDCTDWTCQACFIIWLNQQVGLHRYIADLCDALLKIITVTVHEVSSSTVWCTVVPVVSTSPTDGQMLPAQWQ